MEAQLQVSMIKKGNWHDGNMKYQSTDGIPVHS